MNFLFVIDDLGAGGAQRQMVSLAKYLTHKGCTITFLYYHPNHFYKIELHQAGITTFFMEGKSNRKRMFGIRKFIRKGKYNAVLAFLGTPSFFCEMAGLGGRSWKLVVGERSANPSILKSRAQRTKKIFHHYADCVVSNSHTNAQMIRQVVPSLKKDKLEVIYNALDLDLFTPTQGFEFLKNNQLRLVIPASYRRLKNHLRLFEAVEMLEEKFKNKLIVECYGDVESKDNQDYTYPNLKSWIKERGLEQRIILHPATSQIQQVLQHADAIGLFSIFEGLPNAICEGMACGKPIIASNVSDNPKLVESVNGILVDATSVISIHQGLIELLSLSSTQMSEMGQRNREKALLLFNPKVNFERYYNLLTNK